MNLPKPPMSPLHDPSLLDDCVRDAVRRTCRGWLSAHVDDISQSTRLRLVSRVRERPALQLTRAYIRQAARHRAIDEVRHHQSRDAQRSKYELTVAPKPGPRDPESALINREVGGVIREQLERLPDARREAVSLFVDGHGITEIAQRLGCSRKRIDNLVYRGLATLRRELTARGVTPDTMAA
ncbi:MAG: sigma-70 family RNA polymerase sigma factor [Deltaproteobacteria bacterium]|nr:sigma-70 family RNA polymerase sigma factor [Deltaproteobacteria bacterium]